MPIEVPLPVASPLSFGFIFAVISLTHIAAGCSFAVRTHIALTHRAAAHTVAGRTHVALGSLAHPAATHVLRAVHCGIARSDPPQLARIALLGGRLPLAKLAVRGCAVLLGPV